VQLSAGWIFVYSTTDLPAITEPENGLSANFVSFLDPTEVAPLITATKLSWTSDVPLFGFSGGIVDSLTIGVFQGTLTLTSIATGVELSDQTEAQTVPDCASTLLLLGLSLLLLANLVHNRTFMMRLG
jgi:hypothetical protein